MRRLALLFSLLSLIAFVAAFALPFTSSTLELRFSPAMQAQVATFSRPCGAIAERVVESVSLLGPFRSQLESACESAIQPGWESARGEALDRVLGPVVTDGQSRSWGACLSAAEARGQGEGVSAVEACARDWIIDKAGLPVGERHLFGILSELFSAGEAGLGVLVLLFSVLFPLSKVLLSVACSLSDRVRKRLLRPLQWTSRWSMTDVFVVALVIVFLKAERVHFHFHAEAGVYAFAAGALLSSLAVLLLERDPVAKSSAR
jgi:hypothetical protein